MRHIAFLFALIVMLMAVGVTGAQMSIPDELPMGLTIDYWHEWDGAAGGSHDADHRRLQQQQRMGHHRRAGVSG